MPPMEDWDCRLSHGLLTSLGHSEIISICWGQLVLRISFVSQLIPWKIFSSRCHCAISAQAPAKQLFHFIIRIVEAAFKAIEKWRQGNLCERCCQDGAWSSDISNFLGMLFGHTQGTLICFSLLCLTRMGNVDLLHVQVGIGSVALVEINPLRRCIKKCHTGRKRCGF